MDCGKRRIVARQRGFILALLLAMITAAGILLTKAMPSIVAEVQRDQEEELIFRGEAIRNAMRRYKALTGNYPTRLDDLVKVRPPILRKLYKDPMTADGEWEIVTAVTPGAQRKQGRASHRRDPQSLPEGQLQGLPGQDPLQRLDLRGLRRSAGHFRLPHGPAPRAGTRVDEDSLNTGAP